MVAQGCTQIYGLDSKETFTPVFRFESEGVLLAIGAQYASSNGSTYSLQN